LLEPPWRPASSACSPAIATAFAPAPRIALGVAFQFAA
jgi:hypothetical protein